jgi:tungstate transport system substrate-binding protein
MKNAVYFLLAGTLLILAAVTLSGCLSALPDSTDDPFSSGKTPLGTPAGPKTRLLLATTTSLYDTGLLEYLKPEFERQYNAELLITSQGTGKALEIAKRGDCDILAVHSPEQEQEFIDGGYGINRKCFAYNYFIVVGPADDPAGIAGMAPDAAFSTIMAKGTVLAPGVSFVSRGDNSGTHAAEKKVWRAAGINDTGVLRQSGNWYIEAGRGMGETLQLASEKGAYTLTDEGTYLAYQGNLRLVPLITKGDILLNVYSVIVPYNSRVTPEKIELANAFVRFMLSPETQDAIDAFGREKYGKNLFSAMHDQCSMFRCNCTILLSPGTS